MIIYGLYCSETFNINAQIIKKKLITKRAFLFKLTILYFITRNSTLFLQYRGETKIIHFSQFLGKRDTPISSLNIC